MNQLRCSFCKKSKHEVKVLIAGSVLEELRQDAVACICDGCAKLCNDIINTEIRAHADEPNRVTNQSTTTQDHLGQREAWEALQNTARVKP